MCPDFSQRENSCRQRSIGWRSLRAGTMCLTGSGWVVQAHSTNRPAQSVADILFLSPLRNRESPNWRDCPDAACSGTEGPEQYFITVLLKNKRDDSSLLFHLFHCHQVYSSLCALARFCLALLITWHLQYLNGQITCKFRWKSIFNFSCILYLAGQQLSQIWSFS